MDLKLRIFVPRRTNWFGPGIIAGQAPGLVTIDGEPAACEVRLVYRFSGKTVERKASQADGTYLFSGLTLIPEAWQLIAIDPGRTHNAVIADLLTAVLPPE